MKKYLIMMMAATFVFASCEKEKNSTPDDAFYQAFGTKVSDFEKQFKPF